MNLSELENKYVLVSLYGVNRAKRPESVEMLLPRLRREWGTNAKSRGAALNQFIWEVIGFGKDACGLNLRGIEKDSLEYDSLKEKAKAHSDISFQFALQCYSMGMLPGAALETETKFDKNNKSVSQFSINTEAQKNKAQEVKHDAMSSEDLFQSIMNNSGSEERENADPEWEYIKKTLIHYRTWTTDYGKMRELNLIITELEKNNSSHLKEARSILENGKKIKELQNRAFRAENEQELKHIHSMADALQASDWEHNSLLKQFERGKERRLYWINNKETGSTGIQPPNYDPASSNPHFIGNLAPCSKWTIMVDESGSDFSDRVFMESVKKNEKGHFVALLIPQGSNLPPLGMFHSTEAAPRAVAGNLDKLLHTNSPCGIIGITLDGMAKVHVDYWYNGLERLFDLILRLLPIKGEKTTLDIYVEARGSSKPEMVQRSLDSSLYRMAKVDQDRALAFNANATMISKTNSRDPVFSAWNGYVDAVAYSWCCSNNDLRSILLQYGLFGTCLMEGSSQNLYEVIDDVKCGRLPAPERWSELLLLPTVSSPDSLAAKLLADIGGILHQSPSEWIVYLNHLVAHLDSKAINMRTLGKQISFLKKYQPDESDLPPRLQLLWLTAKLAESNHRGAIIVEAFDKFKNLVRELYEEDAPLTCYATLHLAVNYTNAYRFEEAQAVVENYLRLISNASWGKELPPGVHSIFDLLIPGPDIEHASFAAIPGLRYFAQLISSHGQHEAFLGNNKDAIRFFCEANRLFAKLSDRVEAKKEISQTSAYLLTSLMDLEKPDSELFNATLKSYFGDNLASAASRLAVSDKSEDKYRLHILLRYILSGKAPDSIKSAVLSQKALWKTDSGHPWEMIEFYRGLLLSTPAERMNHLKKARELCAGNDATLHVIEAVILGTILLEDSSVLPHYHALIAKCVSELPELGEKRIAILRDQPRKRLPALELAKIILPFNFR